MVTPPPLRDREGEVLSEAAANKLEIKSSLSNPFGHNNKHNTAWQLPATYRALSLPARRNSRTDVGRVHFVKVKAPAHVIGDRLQVHLLKLRLQHRSGCLER